MRATCKVWGLVAVRRRAIFTADMDLREDRMVAPAKTLTVQCRFFARYADTLGRDSVALELPDPATVADAVQAIRTELASGNLLPERPLVAVNREHALPSRSLADGDEVAFLPPLAGG